MNNDELKIGLTNKTSGIVWPGGNPHKPHHIYFEACYSPDLSHFEFLHELIEHLEVSYEALLKFNAKHGYNTPWKPGFKADVINLSHAHIKPLLTAADLALLREMRIRL